MNPRKFPERVALGLLLVLHFAIWTLEPILLAPNVPLDAAELAILGRQWAWGYHNHPPLPPVAADLVCQAVGPGLASTALAITCQLCVLATLWLVWRLAKPILPPFQAFLCVLLLETTSYYTWITREWNHNLAMLPFVACAVLALDRALKTNRLRWWAMLGVSLGLGASCKYAMALLGLSLALFILINPRARHVLRTPGPYLAGALTFIILAPHLVWVAGHGFPTLHYIADRSSPTVGWQKWLQVPAFFVGQIAYLGLFFAVLFVILGLRPKRRLLDDEQRQTRNLVVFATLGPLAILAAFSIFTGRSLVTAWAAPFFPFLGVAVLLSFEVTSRRRVALAFCIFGALLNLTGAAAADTVWPCLRGRGQRVHFPGRALSELVRQEWQNRFHTTLPMLAGERWIADNVAFYAPGRRRPLAYDRSITSHTEESLREFSQRGGVLLWNADAETTADLPPFLRHEFPEAQASPPLELSWATRCELPPLHIGIAFVPPKPEPSGP